MFFSKQSILKPLPDQNRSSLLADPPQLAPGLMWKNLPEITWRITWDHDPWEIRIIKRCWIACGNGIKRASCFDFGTIRRWNRPTIEPNGLCDRASSLGRFPSVRKIRVGRPSLASRLSLDWKRSWFWRRWRPRSTSRFNHPQLTPAKVFSCYQHWFSEITGLGIIPVISVKSKSQNP